MKMSVLGKFGASRLILETFCILVKTELAKNHFTLCPFQHMTSFSCCAGAAT